MNALRGTAAARAIGMLAGITAAVAFLVASRPASGGDAIGLEVSASVMRTGDLITSPAGPSAFMSRDFLDPGQSLGGKFTVQSASARRLRVVFGARQSDAGLNRLLKLRIQSGGVTLAQGYVGELGEPGGTALVLSPAGRANVRVRAWLPQSSPPGWEARLTEIALTMSSSLAGDGGGNG